MSIIIETERIIVRELCPDDVNRLYAITGDAELMRYVDDGQPLPRELNAKWIEVSINNYRTKGYGCSAVISKADGDFIGYCGLVYSDHIEPPHESELIYALKKSHWGQGLATEVAGAMVAYGFAQCGLKRIVATIDADNVASAKVLQKVGMRYFKRVVEEDGVVVDYYDIENPPPAPLRSRVQGGEK